jgi:acid phosphatase
MGPRVRAIGWTPALCSHNSGENADMSSVWIQFALKRATSKSVALVWLGCVFFAVTVPAQDKLVFAIDIIRHGDRTPLSNPFGEDMTNYWPEGIGRLTPLGTNQEYALGVQMKNLYYRELLDSNSAPNSICVFSTDTDRTRMSARLFLSGLVGAAAQSIPINLRVPVDITAGLSDSNAISAGLVLDPDKTPNLRALQSNYVLRTPEWMAANAAIQPQFARWSQALGRRINSIQDLSGLSDTLYIHQIHHVLWTNRLSPDDIDAIIAAGRWAFVYEYNLNIGRVTGKALLKKISEYMENARREEVSRKETALKYVLFSAHDNTLLSEMSALRAPLTGTNAPPYAALLHFGLFEAGPANFYMRVTYKDRADHVVPDPEDGGASWSLEHLSNLAGQ